MKFWLGVHRPNWLAQLDVGLFISHRRLRGYKTLPRAIGDWCLDSGGFTQLSTVGYWDMSESEYVEAVERYSVDVGNLSWAAPMDWMCEPHVLAITGLTVEEHQWRTVENYMSLRGRGPFVPVIQGWQVGDYLRCVDMYRSVGVNLATEPVVGIGSVCRRQGTSGAVDLLLTLAQEGIKLHGFGLKLTALRQIGYLLASADSMAWSYAGRRQGTCMDKKSKCANCLHYALSWRERVIRSMDYQQTHLGVPA